MTTPSSIIHKEPVFPPFNPFVRHPLSTLAKLKMVLFGPILVPIRLIGAISTMATALVWVNICSLGVDLSKPYTPMRRRILQGVCRVGARVLLFFYGFLWIRESYEITDKEERAKEPYPSVVVINHIGFAELLYLSYSDGCCFVSKEANRSLPFMGRLIEALQSIFVVRGEEASSSTSNESSGTKVTAMTTTEKILERAHSPADTWPPLALCPEGTTHTGHVMLKFATGAFRAGVPVQPVVVSSPFSTIHGYDPSFSCANIITHILCLMTQPMNHLHARHLAVYVPSDAEKKDPVLFASNVRRKMAAELGVKCYDLTWTDKLPYENSKKARELGLKKLAERNGGVAPPRPIFTEDAFGNALVVEESVKDK